MNSEIFMAKDDGDIELRLLLPDAEILKSFIAELQFLLEADKFDMTGGVRVRVVRISSER